MLAAAVSNAGGLGERSRSSRKPRLLRAQADTLFTPLGILTGLTQPTPEKLREAIREMRTLTDKPFAVNLVSRYKTAGWSAWDSRRVSC